MLVPQQFGQLHVHAPHARLCSLPADPNPYRKRVDERPQHTVRPCPTLHPSEQHRPKHHIVPPRHFGQNLRPCHVAHSSRTHPKLACAHSQTPRQTRIHCHIRVLNPSPIPLYIQQPKRCRRLLHISQHLAEEHFVLLFAHPQTHLRHQIPE